MSKIWAICGGGDWFDASINHVILPDGMSMQKVHEEYKDWLDEYRDCRNCGKPIEYMTFTEYVLSIGGREPSKDVLEEWWED